MTNYTDIFYKGKLPSRVCLFCAPNPGMTILETRNFRLIADTYPIISGHLMISSKDHYSSAGELPDHLHEEFFKLKTAATNMALKMENSYAFYEHGKAGSCHAQTFDDIHCEHFHLHCLPMSICVHSKIAKQFSGIKMESYSDLFSYYNKYGSYLYFENSNNEMIYYPAEQGKVLPHYLRTLICEKLKIDSLADWQSYIDLDRYLISRKKIENSNIKELAYALL